MKEKCKHLQATIQSGDEVGFATCPICKKKVYLFVVFNNWLNELSRIHQVYMDTVNAK